MKLKWIIQAADERAYRAFVARWLDHEFVRERRSRNLKRIGIDLTVGNFWHTLVGCLLTTQQPSGETSKVAKFLLGSDPLLDWNHCRNARRLAIQAERTLAANGMRRGKMIGEELSEAATYLRRDWGEVSTRLQGIAARTSRDREREVAGFLRSTFKGIGPKQSRNLIQWLGLSRFEVPLDSRMVKVLRGLQFPVPLSPIALSDENYYCFVEDGVQSMLAQIGIYPCIFDPCVFASLERVESTPRRSARDETPARKSRSPPSCGIERQRDAPSLV